MTISTIKEGQERIFSISNNLFTVLDIESDSTVFILMHDSNMVLRYTTAEIVACSSIYIAKYQEWLLSEEIVYIESVREDTVSYFKSKNSRKRFEEWGISRQLFELKGVRLR